MTIYGLYLRNGNRAGFWVQHRTWKNLCAYVHSIGGLENGALPGQAPMHDRVPVQFCGFDVRSGRPLSAATYNFEPTDRSFVLIAEPVWSHQGLRRWRESSETDTPAAAT